MASLNKVFLLGNLTRDPDLRFTPSGAAVCDLGLAVSRRFMANDQEQEEVCFVDIVVWGKPAENCKQYLLKGSSVLVEGRLQFDQWEDRNGGGRRSKLRVVADRVQFNGSPKNTNASRDNGGYQQDYAPRDNGGYQQNYAQNNNMHNGQQNYNSMPQNNGMTDTNPFAAPPAMPTAAFNPDGSEGEDDIPF